MARRQQVPQYCSFCGKEQREVLVLIAGPGVFICDECVGSAVAIIAKEKIARATKVVETKTS